MKTELTQLKKEFNDLPHKDRDVVMRLVFGTLACVYSIEFTSLEEDWLQCHRCKTCGHTFKCRCKQSKH